MTLDLSDKPIPDSRRLEMSCVAFARESSSLLPFIADIIDVNEFETLLIGSPEPEVKSSSRLSAACEATSIAEEEEVVSVFSQQS